MTRPRRQLVVLARWPAPGRCKRRLAAGAGCSPRLAAAVQRRLSWHTLQTAAAAAQIAEAELLLAGSGLGAQALQRWGRQLLPAAGLGLQRQAGGSLGSRMQHQLRRAFRRGVEQVVLIGSDLPGLEKADLTQAFQRLEHNPLVLGPAGDGGYWLIGLNRQGFRRCGPWLMSGVPWGSAAVLALTLERARDLELPVALLRQQDDLDGITGLQPWLVSGSR